MGSILSVKNDSNCILTILMAKPIQFTKVSPVPFNSVGTDAATMVENWGESETTTIPQMHNKAMKSWEGI